MYLSLQYQTNLILQFMIMEKTKWAIDPSHSEITFRVKHLMISHVSGSFSRFNGTVETNGDDLAGAKVSFTADIDSITTGNEQRDAHLKNGDFFDAEKYPQLVFESDGLERINDELFELHGTLTMRGTGKKVDLKVEYGGMAQDPWGNTRTGFTVTGKINRKDFGVSFGMVSETGGVMLGEEVTIQASVQFVKQVAKQAA
jgi:polyisoprenoid-binding protein YceI